VTSDTASGRAAKEGLEKKRGMLQHTPCQILLFCFAFWSGSVLAMRPITPRSFAGAMMLK
jgi:hypothetical protein